MLSFVATGLSGCDGKERAAGDDKAGVCRQEPWERARRNPRRFIAHAGGEIDARRYTNSREALDISYAKGFRMLELDLIKTLDGELVAAHDWDHWRGATGSATPTPTLAEFKATLLHGKYQPLALGDIVKWFDQHRDAVLVTDKTDDYPALARAFRDPERLVVEVFSLAHFDHALRSGIRYPMISLEWATRFEHASIAALAGDRRTRFFAFPATRAVEQERALRVLSAAGKCVYAYSSNETAFVERGVRGLFYGVYTDTWDLRTGEPALAGTTY
jgi:glycerophosphoryl diester phosphodiesterase